MTLLLCIASIAAVLFACTSPSYSRTTISWTPNSSQDNGQLVLSRGWPEQMKVVSSCNRIRQFTGGNFLDMGGLVMSTRESSLVVESPIPALFSSTTPIPRNDCKIVVFFNSDKGTLTTRIDGVDSVTQLGRDLFPKVDKIVIPMLALPTVMSVELLTRPNGIVNQGIRIWFGLVAILAIILIFSLIRIADSRNHGKRARQFPKILLLDMWVFSSLFIGSLVMPPLPDDGWVWQRLQSYPGRGVFGNYFSNFDAWLPQGFIHEYFLHLLISVGFSYFWLKFVVVLVLFISWVVTKNRLIIPLVGRSNNILLVCASIWIAYSTVWLLTLRAEPWVILCSTLSLAGLIDYLKEGRQASLFLSLVASGVAVTLHQTGWVVLGSALVAVFSGLRQARSKNEFFPLLVTVFTSGALVVVLLFLPMDLDTFLVNAREFSHSISHSQGGPVFEWKRYLSLLQEFGSSGPRIYSVLLLASVCVLSALQLNALDSLRTKIWYSCLFSALLLSLTNSKWIWHFGVLLLPTVLMMALALLSKNNFYLVNSFFVLLAGLTLTIPHSWSFYDLSQKTWGEFSATFGPETHQNLWLFLALTACPVLFRKHRVQVTTIFLSFILLIPLLFSGIWIIFDSLNSTQWSYVRQNISQASGAKTCGALDKMPVITNLEPLNSLVSAEEQNSPKSRYLVADAYPKIPGLKGGPWEGLDTWGSWFVPAEGTKRIAPLFDLSNMTLARLKSPRFSPGSSRKIGLWTTAGRPDFGAGEIVFLNQDLRVISGFPLTFPSGAMWSLNSFTVPRGTQSISIYIDDKSDSTGGWGAVSSPFVATENSSFTALEESTALAGPFTLLRFPCAHLPIPINGFWPKVDYLINDTTFEFRILEAENRVQVACSNHSDACLDRIKYNLANVKVVNNSSESGAFLFDVRGE